MTINHRSNKVHIICPCFGVDNFRQFWSFCIYPIARLSIIPSLCEHNGSTSRLPVLSQRDR